MIRLSLHDLPILIALAGFALMGVGALAAPTSVTRQFGIQDLTPAGRNEVRAVYGGFGITMAIMLAAALLAAPLRTGVCLTLAAALAGMAGGRLFSFLIDRKIGRAPLFYFGIEVVLAGLLLFGA
ncbi:MAG: DUF4345 family protein [Proteobacteria bacterium]|nr:DUF4345 family protein [Pseudomonadota bacterium]